MQEEIRFSIEPELLASLLICEVMLPTEAIFLSGTEQYCQYKGYRLTLQYGGDHRDKTPRYSSSLVFFVCQTLKELFRDGQGNFDKEVVAMDATNFKRVGPETQFLEPSLKREVWKAYAAFTHPQHHPRRTWPIATGTEALP